jgi:hypothetical protein
LKERAITKNGKTAVARIPESEDILNIQVGSLAPNPWGNMARVARIAYQGTTQTGSHYICYYTVEPGPGRAWISNSVCSGKLIRTAILTLLLTSAECDALENSMNAAGDTSTIH